MRVEHQYQRCGVWTYLAALDVQRAHVVGRGEAESQRSPGTLARRRYSFTVDGDVPRLRAVGDRPAPARDERGMIATRCGKTGAPGRYREARTPTVYDGRTRPRRRMRIRQYDYIDRNSPGTMDVVRGEREAERPLAHVEVPDDLPAPLAALVRRAVYRPAESGLLPAERFSDARATSEQRRMIHAPETADQTGKRSRAVQGRLASSCAGWAEPPGAWEFQEAVRAEAPDERQRAILDVWATEAEWHELLAAWTEDAYTLRELVAALHRAGLSRCQAAASLNSWATPTD